MTAERYDDAFDLAVENDSHSKVVRAVARGSRVLDLGCATGRLAGTLTARGCEVVGVEADPASAAIARERCAEVHVLDLDGPLDLLAGLGEFDVIICADVLEHLKAPERLLSAVVPLVRPGTGYLVASIPNVAHGSVRLALLSGAFPYEETGLLDDTHLRFYTHESMPTLLRAGGFEPVFVDSVRLPPLEGSALTHVDVAALPAAAVQAVRDDPTAWDYQFVVVAQPQPAESGPLRLLARADTELRRLGAELGEVQRGYAVHDGPEVQRQLTQAAVRSEAAAMLTDQRISAAEQALSAALDALDERARQLTAAAEATAAEARRADAAEAGLADIFGSRLWKAGQLYRRAVHLLRRR